MIWRELFILVIRQQQKKYVQIDIEKYGDIWPDLLDIIIANERKEDKEISFKDVKEMVESGTS